MEFLCGQCNVSFLKKQHLVRHLKTKHGDNSFGCPHCPKSFTRKDNFDRHIGTHVQHVCGDCGLAFPDARHYSSHRRTCGKTKNASTPIQSSTVTQPSLQPSDSSSKPTASSQPRTRKCRKALGGDAIEVTLPGNADGLDLYLESQREAVSEELIKIIEEKKGAKWYLVVEVQFVRPDDWVGEIREQVAFFTSTTETLLEGSDLDVQTDAAFAKILDACDSFTRNGSGWLFHGVLKSVLFIGTFRPLEASSYIHTPSYLAGRHAVINIRNNDQHCFLWSVLSALHPVEKNSERVSKYQPFYEELDTSSLSFPTPITQVKKFSEDNGLSINIFGYEGEVFPLYISENGYKPHINLLLITEGENNHYVWIKSLSRLLSDLTAHAGKSFYCNYCLHRYSSQRLLNEHNDMCRVHGAQKIKYPTGEDAVMSFKNIRKMLPVPYIIYADFECFSRKISGPSPDPTKSNTTEITHFTPSGYCLVVVDQHNNLVEKPDIYRGEDAVEMFLQKLVEVEKELLPELQKNVPLNMQPADEIAFQQATTCHICELPLPMDPNAPNPRVRDHDHLTGLFRGAAHQECNIQLQVPNFIPVVFHNFKGFDSHLIAQGIGQIKDHKISCIGLNMEKYISFSLGNLRFIDSFQFMAASLDSLTNDLAKEGSQYFNVLKQHFPAEKIPLLLRKGVFCYDYLDSPSKFHDKELPPKAEFFNKLSQEEVSDKDYEHAQEVWRTFNITNLGQYHDLYMATDVFLLADIFQNFRKICMSYYRLDPAQYMTSPGLSWDAALRMTGVKLELFTDPEMYLFCESAIRGGICMISQRYFEANNPYIPGSFNPKESTKYISYLDMNNLYGTAMIAPLPTGGFKWLEDPTNFNVSNVAEDSPQGYFLEVDLEYPDELHDIHSDYPLAPESMCIDEEMLSPYSADLLNVTGFKHVAGTKKLVPNLSNKEKYILHYRNLQFYVAQGLRVTKIHRVLQFNQSAWLKPYIEFNTEKRKVAKSEFKKGFFKLMNNSVFGKTMQNDRNHVDIELVHNNKKLRKRVAKPSFHRMRIFNEDLVGVECKRVSLTLNKPIYVGCTILDISKLFMYNFHYNHIVPTYGSKARLLFTDTDSLCYAIETEDVYKDMLKDINLYDTSDFPETHFLYSEVNKMVLGKFKDEISRAIAIIFVGLRPKCYSFKTTIGEKNTAKGVSKVAQKRYICHDDYVDVIRKKEPKYSQMHRIVSKRHELYILEMNKLSLSAADDKRYILPDGVHTLAHGHYAVGLLESGAKEWETYYNG